jgi:hypothetical protein
MKDKYLNNNINANMNNLNENIATNNFQGAGGTGINYSKDTNNLYNYFNNNIK